MDETGTLKENEVYVGVPDAHLHQKVLITKHPISHLGDLRVMNTAQCPKLSHFRNVIVFPKTKPGNRPVQDMVISDHNVLNNSRLVEETLMVICIL